MKLPSGATASVDTNAICRTIFRTIFIVSAPSYTPLVLLQRSINGRIRFAFDVSQI